MSRNNKDESVEEWTNVSSRYCDEYDFVADDAERTMKEKNSSESSTRRSSDSATKSRSEKKYTEDDTKNCGYVDLSLAAYRDEKYKRRLAKREQEAKSKSRRRSERDTTKPQNVTKTSRFGAGASGRSTFQPGQDYDFEELSKFCEYPDLYKKRTIRTPFVELEIPSYAIPEVVTRHEIRTLEQDGQCIVDPFKVHPTLLSNVGNYLKSFLK